jgi:hypothetical protein
LAIGGAPAGADLLPEDHLLHQAGAAALSQPPARKCRPSRRHTRPLPRLQEGEVVLDRFVAPCSQSFGACFAKPSALVAKLRLVGCEIQRPSHASYFVRS